MPTSLSVIIPAAGCGRRMRCRGPKTLLPIHGNETILSRQIRIIKKIYPRATICVVAGFGGNKVARAVPNDVCVVRNDDFEETGVARSIGIGLTASPAARSLIVYGDLIFNDAALASFPATDSWILEDSTASGRGDEVGITVVNDEVTCFDYGLPRKWAHIAMLAGKELAMFTEMAMSPACRTMFSFELFNRMLDSDGRFGVVTPRRLRLREIDSPQDLR